MKIYDAIVIGSGISGMSAAIYLKRANLDIAIFESYIPGGQINNTSNIENYPGFIKIDGPTLVINIQNQINEMNIPLKYEKVIKITKKENFIIETNKEKYITKNVVVATGRTPNKLGIEDKFIGKGVSYCALCDGFLYKNLEVIVVGGGNSAFEESLYLSKICKKVTILNRSEKLRATKILQNEVFSKKNIEIIYNCTIEKINSENEKIVSVNTNKGIINCSGIFIYIGLTPNLEYLNIDVKTENNYIIVDNKMKTNVKGLYACGDVIKKDVYQIITAASEGAIAATNLIKDMEM
jgi:thioredoxin reductase (NADPH)